VLELAALTGAGANELGGPAGAGAAVGVPGFDEPVFGGAGVVGGITIGPIGPTVGGKATGLSQSSQV